MDQKASRLAETILIALRQDDPAAFMGEPKCDGRTTIDGRFNLYMVAAAVLRIIEAGGKLTGQPSSKEPGD